MSHFVACLMWFFLLSTSAISVSIANPLGLDWKKRYEDVPTIKKYKYLFGDPVYGRIYYSSQEYIEGLETELQVLFSEKRMVSAVLILGPVGFNDANCFAKLEKVVSALDAKYGNHYRTTRKEHADLNDLFYTNKCVPVRNDLLRISKWWKTDTHQIVLSFFGGDGEYFIEVEYKNSFNNTNSNTKSRL